MPCTHAHQPSEPRTTSRSAKCNSWLPLLHYHAACLDESCLTVTSTIYNNKHDPPPQAVKKTRRAPHLPLHPWHTSHAHVVHRQQNVPNVKKGKKGVILSIILAAFAWGCWWNVRFSLPFFQFVIIASALFGGLYDTIYIYCCSRGIPLW